MILSIELFAFESRSCWDFLIFMIVMMFMRFGEKRMRANSRFLRPPFWAEGNSHSAGIHFSDPSSGSPLQCWVLLGLQIPSSVSPLRDHWISLSPLTNQPAFLSFYNFTSLTQTTNTHL